MYAAGDDRLLLVARDRISAYDHVLPTPIPDKGRVLTALSVWWFEQLADLGARTTWCRADGPGDPGRGGAAGRCWCGGWRCCRSSAWPAATWPAPGWRPTAPPARSAASRCRPGWSTAPGCPSRCSRPTTKARGRRARRGDRLRRGRSTGRRRPGRRAARPDAGACTAGARRSRASAGILLADTKLEFGAGRGRRC